MIEHINLLKEFGRLQERKSSFPSGAMATKGCKSIFDAEDALHPGLSLVFLEYLSMNA